MPRRVSNTFQAQTPWGQGLTNIADAMFNKPSQAQMEKNRALMEMHDAQAGQGMMQIRNNTRANDARDNIAGMFEQMQMLQQQSDGMEDPGLDSYTRNMPAGVAKYGMKGNLDPTVAGAFAQMAMSQSADEDTQRRLSSSFRGPAGARAAFTGQGVEDVNEAVKDRTIAQAIAQAQGQMQRDDAAPVTVKGPGGQPILMRTADAIEQQVPVAPKSNGRAPMKLTTSDLKGLYGMLNDYVGGQSGTDLPLDPATADQIVSRAAQIAQQTRNIGTAIPMAYREIVGGGRLVEDEASDPTSLNPLTWFSGPQQLRVDREQPATAGGSAAPPARQGAGQLQPGTAVDGYIFKGGNPNNPDNWELAS